MVKKHYSVSLTLHMYNQAHFSFDSKQSFKFLIRYSVFHRIRITKKFMSQFCSKLHLALAKNQTTIMNLKQVTLVQISETYCRLKSLLLKNSSHAGFKVNSQMYKKTVVIHEELTFKKATSQQKKRKSVGQIDCLQHRRGVCALNLFERKTSNGCKILYPIPWRLLQEKEKKRQITT